MNLNDLTEDIQQYTFIRELWRFVKNTEPPETFLPRDVFALITSPEAQRQVLEKLSILENTQRIFKRNPPPPFS